MAFTFLKATGLEIGNSLRGRDADFAKASRSMRFRRGVKFYLPVDCVVAASPTMAAETRSSPCRKFPKAGTAWISARASVEVVQRGHPERQDHPVERSHGRVRDRRLARGTLSVAHAVANAYALTIVGGGETALAVHRAGESEDLSYLDRRRRRSGAP